MDALPDDVLGRVFGALLLDGDGGFDDDGAGAPAPPWQRSNVGAALRLPPHTNLYRLRERCRAAGVVALVCGRWRAAAAAATATTTTRPRRAAWASGRSPSSSRPCWPTRPSRATPARPSPRAAAGSGSAATRSGGRAASRPATPRTPGSGATRSRGALRVPQELPLRAGALAARGRGAPPLLALDVSGTAVDDAGLAAIAAAQRRRPSLTSLSVYGCGNVTGAGLGAFAAPLPLRRLSVGANRRVAAEHVGALAASARATLRELDASRVSRSALGFGFEATLAVACGGAPAPEPSPGEVQAAALAARNRAWWDALGDALDHWALGLLVATPRAAVERVALTGQVQQLMSLRASCPSTGSSRSSAPSSASRPCTWSRRRQGVARRCSAALEARGRARWLAASKVDAAAGDEVAELAAPEKGLELATASRLLVVDAAPKAFVELLFGVAGAAGALYASPPLALFFVGHEAFMAQLVGAVAGARRWRDGAARREESAKEAWAGEVAGGAAYPYADPELRLAVLSSYVLAGRSSKRALGIDGDKYQKVMGFAGGFMQAAQEVNGCAEKLGRGTELMALLHKLEDAKASA
ncbi:hypothetical protein JL722_558 [Aureococcus anophagefferens]|nr:hypothetical protein JL722_558 [Aureococcus anophagefferens]